MTKFTCVECNETLPTRCLSDESLRQSGAVRRVKAVRLLEDPICDVCANEIDPDLDMWFEPAESVRTVYDDFPVLQHFHDQQQYLSLYY